MGRNLLVTAPAAFILYQGLNVLGVIIESSRNDVFRLDWPVLVSMSFLMFVIGGMAANVLYGFNPREEVVAWRRRPLEVEDGDLRARWIFVWFMIIVCLVAG